MMAAQVDMREGGKKEGGKEERNIAEAPDIVLARTEEGNISHTSSRWHGNIHSQQVDLHSLLREQIGDVALCAAKKADDHQKLGKSLSALLKLYA